MLISLIEKVNIWLCEHINVKLFGGIMKIYKLQGLDCPNCAKKLEKEINKLDSIKNAEIDF